MKKYGFSLLFLLVACVLLVGCGGGTSLLSSSAADWTPLESAGTYSRILVKPNGEIWVCGKVDADKVKDAGFVYRVEMNGDKKPSKITAMAGDSIVSASWDDTLGNTAKFATLTAEYKDDFVKYSFKDAHGTAQKGFYGAHAIRYKMADKKAKIAYLYNAEGEQANNGDGFSQMLFTYNDKGMLSKISFADVNGNRVTTEKKIYELHLKYADGEKNPRPIEIANYGKDESFMVDNTGIAKTTYKFDEKNRCIEVRHFGSDDTLKIKKSRFSAGAALHLFSAGAITKYRYEGADDRPVEISFYGTDEQPLGLKESGNAASFKFTLGKFGITSVKALSTDGMPAAADVAVFGENVAEVLFEYGDRGEISGMSFKGKDGNAVVSSTFRCAAVRSKHDERGRESELSFYGTSGDAVNVQGGRYSYHRVVKEYNDEDELGQEIYYDKDGKEVGRERHKTRHRFTSMNASPEELAQKALESQGVACNISVTTYGHDSNGFLALDTSKGRRILLFDQQNGRVAEVQPRTSFASFAAQRSKSYQSPWIVNFTILNDVRDNDNDFGTWYGPNHFFPIYMQYSFNSDGTVKPGMLTSGNGPNPSHFQGYLKEPKNVDLANLLLTEALTFLEKAQAAGVSI